MLLLLVIPMPAFFSVSIAGGPDHVAYEVDGVKEDPHGVANAILLAKV